jgi:hypothetical protein
MVPSANQETQSDAKRQVEKSEQGSAIPEQDEAAMARRDFMRTKLMYTQNILEGLTTRNFRMIDAAIRNIEMITSGEQWVALDSDAYRELTADFQKSVKRLKQAAATKNVEATALRFYDVSNRCIDCHQHLQTTKYDL